IETPKREKNGRQVLRSDEYTKMLSLAGANPRDYAILQVFLQTGIRVSELAHLRIEDIDFIKPAITVRGKGSVEREIALEKKGVHALKSYLAVRVESFSSRVFLSHSRQRRMLLKINDLSHSAFVNIKPIESTTYAFYAIRNAASFELSC